MSFLPSAGQFLMKIITVVNRVCACVRTSAEDDNFPKKGEGGGGLYLMILFNLRVFMFWFVRDNNISGNLGFARY